MARLTKKARRKIPTSKFAIKRGRKYPIHDKAHARNALSRVAQHGTAAQKRQVRAAVRRKYPSIGRRRRRG
jgi:hypothetical protein